MMVSLAFNAYLAWELTLKKFWRYPSLSIYLWRTPPKSVMVPNLTQMLLPATSFQIKKNVA